MSRRSNNSPVISLLSLLIVFVIFGVIAYRGGQTNPPSGNRSPSATAAGRLGPADIYPDPYRTPGATNTDIRQDNIDQTICNPRWSTKSVRPPVNYTDRLKREQTREFGDSDTNPRDYEEDHLIPLELGGNPSDPRNLWPEPYDTSIADGGARSKDRVESYLRRQVCSGAVTLGEAQQEIAYDWYRVYVTSVPRN